MTSKGPFQPKSFYDAMILFVQDDKLFHTVCSDTQDPLHVKSL